MFGENFGHLGNKPLIDESAKLRKGNCLMEHLDIYKRSVTASALIEFIANRMGDALTPEKAAERINEHGGLKKLSDRKQAFVITLNQAIATLEIITDSIQEDVSNDQVETDMTELRDKILSKEVQRLAAEEDRLYEVAEIAQSLIARIKANKK